MILVTGGAGLIGGNFVLNSLQKHDEKGGKLDEVTHAGYRDTLRSLKDDVRHIFVIGDIGA